MIATRLLGNFYPLVPWGGPTSRCHVMWLNLCMVTRQLTSGCQTSFPCAHTLVLYPECRQLSTHLVFSTPASYTSSLIIQAIWENQFYYLFGFLFIVFIILIIACSEVAIVMTYFQLCGEDYHWWWRSFILSGSSTFYVLAYSIIYYYTKVLRHSAYHTIQT